MDKIKTSDGALVTADAALRELKENICGSVAKYEAAIKDQFDGIDIDFQNILLEYIEDLLSLQNSVVEFESANRQAIRDRKTRISEYSATAYKRRNIM